MEKEIEKIINSAIDDFNSNWKSHEDRNEGVKCYSEKITGLISQQKDVVICFHKELEDVVNSIDKIQDGLNDETAILQLQSIKESILITLSSNEAQSIISEQKAEIERLRKALEDGQHKLKYLLLQYTMNVNDLDEITEVMQEGIDNIDEALTKKEGDNG